MPDLTPAQDINAARPFKKAARIYRRKGWIGTVPLPPREKNPPPTGYTGRGVPYPDDEMIDRWIDGDIDWSAKPEFRKLDPRKANIGLRMGKCTMPDGSEWDVVGIDVDDYDDGGKIKKGAEQLGELEARLGALPPTFVSSSREGASGIRFFRTPPGHVYRGKAAKDIDVVSPGYRFAVVYPSYHPSGGQYRWQDQKTDEYVERLADLPDPCDLPRLPDKWFDFLTNGGTVDDGRPIDMDSSKQEIEVWARQHFPKPPQNGARDDFGGMCDKMRRAVEYWKKQIEEDPSSHDKVINSHWNLISMAVEGHSGWETACREVENFQLKDVVERGKRGIKEIKLERFRSRINALRKKKAAYDEAIADGIQYITSACMCYDQPVKVLKWPSRISAQGLSGEAASGDLPEDGAMTVDEAIEAFAHDGGKKYPDGMPSGVPEDPDSYEQNDDGNAEHWLDMYRGHVYWIENLGQWMVWDGTKWVLDDLGIARRSFRQVKLRQLDYAVQIAARATDPEDSKDPWVKEAKPWFAMAKKSGDNKNAESALVSARSYGGVTKRAEDLDQHTHLLGMPNGEVLELTEDGPVVREMLLEDFITRKLSSGYIPYSEQEGSRGHTLWEGYLQRFVPDPAIRQFLQAIAGYALLGDNRERLCVFLLGDTSTGKSTFLNAIMSAMGEYAQVVDMNIFKEKPSGLNPALAQALPARVITASEVSQANRLHADVFKRITGNDPVAAELKGVNVVIRRVPAFLPLIATNSPPAIPGADMALERRLCVIPFNERVAPNEDDKSFAHELEKHGNEAVLAWMIEGYRLYASGALKPHNWPSAIRGSVKEFSAELNEVSEFLHERTERRQKTMDNKVLSSGLYDEFLAWCSENNIDRPMTKNTFGRQIRASGIERVKSNGLWYYKGLVLLARDETRTISFTCETGKNDESAEKTK